MRYIQLFDSHLKGSGGDFWESSFLEILLDMEHLSQMNYVNFAVEQSFDWTSK